MINRERRGEKANVSIPVADFARRYPHSYWKHIIRRFGSVRLHRWLTICGDTAGSVILIVFLCSSDTVMKMGIKLKGLLPLFILKTVWYVDIQKKSDSEALL